MGIFKLQIALPDRPGSLGAVASAIGFAGGDIRSLVTLKTENGKGIDDVTVAIPGTDPTDLLQVLSDSGGVEIRSIEPAV